MARPLSERKIQVVKPSPKDEEVKKEKRKLRVAAYCRVSTDSKEQETSFDSQVAYYTDMINKSPDWEFVGIYADPAISGTSRKNRTEFNKMLYDCLKGKIDMVITKSMSRFARNQLDSLAVIRMLNGLHPPVRVIFEDDHINSDDLSSEIIIIFTSMLAEQESVKKSTSVKWGQKRRIEQGFYLVPTQNLVGYDKTKTINKDEREIYIVEDEAVIVRIIYMMFLIGYKVSEIAYELTRMGARTGKGNVIWNSSSVLGILKNERYAGDVRTNKTYRESLWKKKVIKNSGEMPYVYETDHHPAIISHEEFEMAQRLLASHKFGYDPFVTGMYSLTVIDEGLLEGFIPINIHWAGSTLEEYKSLAATVKQTSDIICHGEKIPYFPGCQVVRRQEIGHSRKTSMRITPSSIALSRSCLDLLKSDYIELLFNPIEKLIAIRETESQLPGAVRWKKIKDTQDVPTVIGCTAFTAIVYELMNWPRIWNSSVPAMAYQRNGESVLVFDLSQPEINALPYERKKAKKKTSDIDAYYNIEAMIAQQLELLHNKQDGEVVLKDENEPMAETEELPPPKRQRIIPDSWANSFGEDSAVAALGCRKYQFETLGAWDVMAKGVCVEEYDHHVYVSENQLREQMEKLVEITLRSTEEG